MWSRRHESLAAANLPPCAALPPWQSWQPCPLPGWSVCQARCCWWWRGSRTWGCRAARSGSALQTAAAHLRRPLKCQVEEVNNTKSFRQANNSLLNLTARFSSYLKPSDDEQGRDVELGEGLYHVVHEFVWKCPNTMSATLIRKSTSKVNKQDFIFVVFQNYSGQGQAKHI